MVISSKRRTIINISWSIIQRLSSILLPFLLRTAIIYTLGIQYLGIDSLFVSILSVLNLSELGFGSAVVYALYKPVAENDTKKVKGILSFYKTIYNFVGLIVLVVGLAILPNIKWFIADTSEIPNNVNIYFVYLVFLANAVLSYFLFSYKNALLFASMRNDKDSLFETIRTCVLYFLQILVLVIFKQYYLFIIMLPIVTVVNNLCRNFYINKKYPNYIGKEKLSKSEKKDIFSRVGALIGNKIGGVVFNSVDSLIISKFLGVVVLAQFTNYWTIFMAVFGFESAIYNSFQSVIGHELIKNTKENNYKLFKKMFFINILLTAFCVSCFTSLFQPFISLWVGTNNVLPNIVPFLLVAYFFVKSTRRTLYQFKEAAGMWREDFLKPYISVAANILLNILLVKTFGIPGILFASIFSIAFIEIPWETIVFFKHYFQRNLKEYVILIIFSFIFSGVSFLLSASLADRFETNFLGFLMNAIITVSLSIINCFTLILIKKRL